MQIDIKEIIKEKSSVLAKITFFVSWMRRLLHEKEINDFLSIYGGLQGIPFTRAVIEFFQVKTETIMTSPLPTNGRYIFVANHPLGGLDGIALIKVLSETYKEIRFPVNDILLAIKNFQPLLLPINKHGKQSREVAEKIRAACASLDQQVIMFPAGLVSRKIKGKIADLRWQKNVINQAKKHKRDIIPVYISGKNSKRFYRISNLRKCLGLPNIEMLTLADEMFKQKNNPPLKMIFGEPISYTVFEAQPPGISKKNSAQYWADYLKKQVYDLGSM